MALLDLIRPLINMDCAPCNCQNGTCNEGKSGDGQCSACAEGYFGENCAKAITCKHGVASQGLSGTGLCISCEDGFTDENCSTCTPGLFGENCALCTRPNGQYDQASETDCQLKITTNGKTEVYQVAKIGDLIWLAENLRTPVGDSGSDYIDGASDAAYGYFYSWDAATEACPAGWHLPTISEFSQLKNLVSDSYSDGVAEEEILKSLIAKTTKWQDYPATGYDTFGFSALPAGYYADEAQGVGQIANFWTTYYYVEPFTFKVSSEYFSLTNQVNFGRIGTQKNSVRCVQDYGCNHGEWNGLIGCICDEGFAGVLCDRCATGFSGADCSWQGTTMMGPDGQAYRTVQMGEEVWMAENMASDMALDGSSITCYANTAKDPDFVKHYGCIYNWDEAMKVCPSGWHLPTEAEFWTSSMMNSSSGLNAKLLVYVALYATYVYFLGHETTLTTDAHSVRCLMD